MIVEFPEFSSPVDGTAPLEFDRAIIKAQAAAELGYRPLLVPVVAAGRDRSVGATRYVVKWFSRDHERMSVLAAFDARTSLELSVESDAPVTVATAAVLAAAVRCRDDAHATPEYRRALWDLLQGLGITVSSDEWVTP